MSDKAEPKKPTETPKPKPNPALNTDFKPDPYQPPVGRKVPSDLFEKFPPTGPTDKPKP